MITLLCLALLFAFGSAYAADPVKIGIIGPMQIRPGIAIKQGAMMAAEEINAKGGILGRKIELRYADTEFSPEKGITALNKLAVKDKVEVLIGGMTSGIVLAQMPYLSRYQLPFLGVAVASSTLTKLVKENYDKNKYFFRVGILKDQLLAFDMVQFMATYVGKRYGIKKVAILLEKAKWTEGLDKAFTMLFGKFGMEVVMAEFFEIKTNDYSPIFSKVKKSGAQMTIEVHSHVSEVFIKQYYDQKVPLPVGGIALAAQSSDFWERSGGKCVGEFTSNFIYRIPISSKTIPFWDGYVKRYSEDPLVTATGTYDAIYVYKDAVERAGSFKADKLIPALEKTNYEAALGRIAFEEDHDLKYGPDYVAINWAQWQAPGKVTILYPEDRATGTPQFPEWIQLPQK
jgi:branched-chain amino acid transport system substrate-binding protein